MGKAKVGNKYVVMVRCGNCREGMMVEVIVGLPVRWLLTRRKCRCCGCDLGDVDYEVVYMGRR